MSGAQWLTLHVLEQCPGGQRLGAPYINIVGFNTAGSRGPENPYVVNSAKSVHGLSLVVYSRCSRALQPSSLLAPFLSAR